jgi:hypothetical protein
MEDGFSWRCPFCQQHATVTRANHMTDTAGLLNYGVDGHKILSASIITCPNQKCRKYQLRVWLFPGEERGGYARRRSNEDEPERFWQLVPDSNAVVFPDYVAQQIRDDYTEACRIATLSPKAAATLARRCLQGMIRHVWKVKRKTLSLAIDAIKKKVDPNAWQAIQGVRTVGNIGAHMENNVDLIVSVDPEEAEMLLRLIEALVDDWYIKPHDREALYQGVINVAGAKALARKGVAQPAAAQAAPASLPTPPPSTALDPTTVQPSNALKT